MVGIVLQAAADRKGKGKVDGASQLSLMRCKLLEELELAEGPVLLTDSDPIPDQLVTLAQVDFPLSLAQQQPRFVVVVVVVVCLTYHSKHTGAFLSGSGSCNN